MRSSVDTRDRGFKTFQRARAEGKKVDIFLDGELVPRCVTADEEEGFVLVNVAGEDGRVMIDRETRTVKREVRRGRVRIVLRELIK